MKIAIIGAGFSGLATAWYLLNDRKASEIETLAIFDRKEIGEGTSGIAAGLVHPFVGAHAKFNWMGAEGMEATNELIEVAEQALGFSVKAANQGILRLALKEMQLIDYQKTAAKYPDKTEWLSEEKCQQLVPNGRLAPGLLIRNGLSIYSALYLKGLWLACQSRGASFFLQEVQSLKELDGFDLIILATGADVGFLEESSHLMIRKVKGQILELSWPQGIPPLACTLNSQLYLLMGPSNTSCLLGATYEKNPTDSNISMEFALQELLPKGIELFPPLRDSHILNCYAGIRAVTPDRHPLVQKLSNRLWVLTGMGSKGLLYHALFAKKMVNDAMSEF